jgi:hypothetical protein
MAPDAPEGAARSEAWILPTALCQNITGSLGTRAIVVEYERKRVKLGKTGGSPSVVLPKAWVESVVSGSEVDLVRSEHRIVIEAPRQAPEPDFENEPAFGAFLDLLLRETITHAPLTKRTADLLARSAKLTAGIKLDDD